MSFKNSLYILYIIPLVKLLSCVQLFVTPWTVAYQAPLSMGFSRQEYCSGLPSPSPGDLLNPAIKPTFPAWQADSLPLGNPLLFLFKQPVMSDSLWPHVLQHTRPPCPSPSPRVCPSSHSLPQSCHPAILSSEAFFSFCPQSFPASGTFAMSHLFASDDKNTGASAQVLVLPVNIQGWSLLRLTGLISLLSKGLSVVFSSTTVWRYQLFGTLPSLWSRSHSGTWTLERR